MSVEQRRPTLIDVARLAQVAPSTASRALKESPRISEATRLRVHAAARGLGYQPNRVAQSLRAKTAPFVGIVVPDIGITFYSRFVKGAQEVLEAAGYQALVMNTEREAGHEEVALRTLEGHRVSGILLATSRPKSDEPPIPTVYFDSLAGDRGVARIALANGQGMDLLVGHLAGHGHKRIGYIGGPPIFTSGQERLAGFHAAAERHGIGDHAAYVEIADASWSAESAAAAMARLLALAEPPTAVVASGDTLAMGAIAAAARPAGESRKTSRSSRSTIRSSAALVDPPIDRAAAQRSRARAGGRPALLDALAAASHRRRAPAGRARRTPLCGCTVERPG